MSAASCCLSVSSGFSHASAIMLCACANSNRFFSKHFSRHFNLTVYFMFTVSFADSDAFKIFAICINITFVPGKRIGSNWHHSVSTTRGGSWVVLKWSCFDSSRIRFSLDVQQPRLCDHPVFSDNISVYSQKSQSSSKNCFLSHRWVATNVLNNWKELPQESFNMIYQ